MPILLSICVEGWPESDCVLPIDMLCIFRAECGIHIRLRAQGARKCRTAGEGTVNRQIIGVRSEMRGLTNRRQTLALSSSKLAALIYGLPAAADAPGDVAASRIESLKRDL